MAAGAGAGGGRGGRPEGPRRGRCYPTGGTPGEWPPAYRILRWTPGIVMGCRCGMCPCRNVPRSKWASARPYLIRNVPRAKSALPSHGHCPRRRFAARAVASSSRPPPPPYVEPLSVQPRPWALVPCLAKAERDWRGGDYALPLFLVSAVLRCAPSFRDSPSPLCIVPALPRPTAAQRVLLRCATGPSSGGTEQAVLHARALVVSCDAAAAQAELDDRTANSACLSAARRALTVATVRFVGRKDSMFMAVYKAAQNREPTREGQDARREASRRSQLLMAIVNVLAEQRALTTMCRRIMLQHKQLT